MKKYFFKNQITFFPGLKSKSFYHNKETRWVSFKNMVKMVLAKKNWSKTKDLIFGRGYLFQYFFI